MIARQTGARLVRKARLVLRLSSSIIPSSSPRPSIHSLSKRTWVDLSLSEVGVVLDEERKTMEDKHKLSPTVYRDVHTVYTTLLERILYKYASDPMSDPSVRHLLKEFVHRCFLLNAVGYVVRYDAGTLVCIYNTYDAVVGRVYPETARALTYALCLQNVLLM